MSPSPFYTRSPRLAFVKRLVEEHAAFTFQREDFARVFKAVDRCCSDIFPTEDRGDWFSPIFLGGTEVDHTPPHIINAVYAIYSDLVAGSPEPIPFLSRPLNLDGTTTMQLGPGAGFFVESCNRGVAPTTDLLLRTHAKLPEQWIADIYGTPRLQDVIRVGWNMAAESLHTAISGGYLLLHESTRQVLDPMAPSFTEEEQGLFFAEPVLEERLDRYRQRVSGTIGIPLDVLQRNHDNAKRMLESSLAIL